MAIKTVTQANLAEFVASRPQPPSLSSADAVIQAVQADAGPTPGNPVIKPGVEETVSTAPVPGEQPTQEQLEERKKSKPVQPRIDELVREKHELDAAFQEEYEHRLRLEGELASLKSQSQPTAKAAEQPKDELGPEPKPADFTDQAEFLNKWGEWQRKKARAEFAQEQAAKDAQERARQAEAAMQSKVAQATADFPDFDEVLQSASRRTTELPAHIKAAFFESDVGAHLAYHLAKDPKEEKRIFGLPVAKALLELGKIEKQYQKAEKATEPATTTTPRTEPPTTTPAPVPRLKESPGVIQTDLSKPMNFSDYKAARLEQIRAKGRRRH